MAGKGGSLNYSMINYPKLYSRLLSFYPRITSLLPVKATLPPLHFFILTTYRCNLKCKMCAYLGLHDASMGRDELGITEIKSLIDQTPSFSLLTFTGGELTVRKDFGEMVRYATRKRKAHIVTNGTMITKETAEELVDMGCRNVFAKGLVAVGVSLEGPESVHEGITGIKGSYSKTLNGLKNLVAAKKARKAKYPLISLQVVIAPSTVKYFGELYRMADVMGLNICNFITVNTNIYLQDLEATKGEGLEYCPEVPKDMDIAVLEEQLAELDRLSRHSKVQIRFSPSGITPQEIVRYFKGESRKDNYACLGPWSKVAITPYGDVLVCPFFKVGNIREKSFGALWKNVEAQKFRMRLKTHGLFKGCTQCCWMNYYE